MNENITLDSILRETKKMVEEGIPISPALWLDNASRLAILLQDLDEEIVRAESRVNKQIAQFIACGESSSASKSRVSATKSWEQWKLLEAKKERVMTLIQIGKKRTEIHY